VRQIGQLLNPYAILGRLTTLTLFANHGAVFLALKTKARSAPPPVSFSFGLDIAAAALAVPFLGWTSSGAMVWRARSSRPIPPSPGVPSYTPPPVSTTRHTHQNGQTPASTQISMPCSHC